MKRSLFSLTILLLCSGCAFFGGAHRQEAVDAAKRFEQALRNDYFYEWDRAVGAADELTARYPEASALAHFVAGEARYLAGDHEAAFPHLLTALRGEDPLAALAALHLIRDLYVSRPIALELAATRPVCGSATCRAVIAAESYEWALATGRSWERRRIERDLIHPRRFDLFRAAATSAFPDLAGITAEEEAYRKGQPFLPPVPRRVTLPEGNAAIDLRNYFAPVRNALFFASGRLDLPEGGSFILLPYSTVPFRLYIDGALVLERDADSLSTGVISAAVRKELAAGEHTILIKLAPYLADEGYLSLSFFRAGDTTAEEGDITAPRDRDDPLTTYLRLLARDLLYAAAGPGDWEQWYASVNGSRTPGPLFQTARTYRRSGNGQGAASLLSFIVKERPDLILLKSELMENQQDIGDDDAVRRTVESEEGRERTELPWLLRLSDRYFQKHWYARDIQNAERALRRYGAHPVSYYYLSDAWRAVGDIDKAIRIRQRSVPLIPGYLPTLTRLAELQREAGETAALIRTARQMIELDPHNIEYHHILADAYIADGAWGKAERVLRAALDRNPESAALWARLGDALSLDGRETEAVGAFRNACEREPGSIEYAERLDAFGGTVSALFSAYAASDVAIDQKIAAYRAAAADHPQKYAIVYDEGIQQVHYNGSVRSRFRMVVALNTAEGVGEFATVQNYGRVVSARLVKKDGRSLPSWRADAVNLYFLDAEPGDVVDFVMEASEGPRSWIGGTDFRWFFASEGVYNLHSRLVLRFPEDMAVSFFVRGPVRREERAETGGKIYLFETENLFQPSREEAMPPLVDSVPILSYTTVPSWNDFARWQALFLRDQTEGSADIERQAITLLQGVTGTAARIELLRDWVARQVRYLSDDEGIAKVKPGNTVKTFTEKAGDCKDKTLLLKLLLSYAGIESRYALAKSRPMGAVLRDLPSMQFDHALLYIPPQTGIDAGFFVDAVAGYDHYRGVNPAVAGTDAFVIDERTGGYEFITVTPQGTDRVTLLFTVDGAARLTLEGAAASNGRYRAAIDSDPFSYFAELMVRMAGRPVPVTQCTRVTGPYAEPLEIRCSAAPFFPSLVQSTLGKLAEAQTRHYDLYLADRLGSWRVELPLESMTAIPEDEALPRFESDLFVWRVERTEAALRVTLELKVPRITPQEYPRFREAVIAALALENKMRGIGL